MSDEDYFIPTDEDREAFQNAEDIRSQEEYDIKQLIKGNYVHFSSFRQGFFHYNVLTNNGVYSFPVPINDIGTGTMLATDKAISYMRWIRKAIEDKTFIKV